MKSKKKQPNTKANRELKQSWEALVLKWSSPSKFARSTSNESVSNASPVVSPSSRRETKNSQIRSRVTVGGEAVVAKTLKYTGDKIVGIATMHKSNAVPVFNPEAAKDISSMRR